MGISCLGFLRPGARYAWPFDIASYISNIQPLHEVKVKTFYIIFILHLAYKHRYRTETGGCELM